MTPPTNIAAPIIETLYTEALVLADDVRTAFDLSPGHVDLDDHARIALSIEGLRTTTRIMHVLAWLLNRRAYFAGELSEFQLRRSGGLPADRASDADQLVLIGPAIRALIVETQALHARVARLDKAWRAGDDDQQSAVLDLRERLGRELSAL